MARATYVKKARKPIYETGKQVSYSGKPGSKREGRTMTKIDRTQPADKKDKIFIQAGESYYWWQFMRGPVIYSKTRPRRSQLTRSEFLGWLYDFEDTVLGKFAVPEAELEGYTSDDLKAQVDEWVEEMNTQREELEGRLENMPEGLRDTSDSGNTLTERIEGLETWASDFEAVDLEWDDDELKQEAQERWDQMKEEEREGKTELEWVQEAFLDLKREKIDEIMGELPLSAPF